MFQTNPWFGIGFVKFKIYLSGTSKCSLKTIVVFILIFICIYLFFQLLNLLRNKHLLGYIFKTIILRALLSLKNMWCLPK